MQKYTEISESTTLRESREQLLNNDKTAMTNSSSNVAPSAPLLGQSWFNTETKEFQIWDGESWIATGVTETATRETIGLMSADDKTKLDSVDYKANAYVHPDSGVEAGTYTRVTVDAQGHVTEGSAPTEMSIETMTVTNSLSVIGALNIPGGQIWIEDTTEG